MSWLDNINNTIFTIRTGDGQVYTPDLPINYETIKEFNAATFEFIGQPGALITRKLVRARKFPLVFYFQGADNIDTANAFDISANDPRAWTVRHPQYGDIIGQPISISRNDSKLNATEITVDFWETITTTLPVALASPVDVTNDAVIKFSTISPVDYASKVNLMATDVNTVTNYATQLTGFIQKSLSDSGYTAFITAKNAMIAADLNLITDPIDAIAAMHQVVLQIPMLGLDVQDAITLCGAVYNSLAMVLSTNPTVNNAALFETIGGIIISAMAQSILLPQDGDYTLRSAVESAAENLTDIYNDYLTTLDAAYSPLVNIGNAFTTSQQTQNALQDVVLATLYNLNTIAFNSKIERYVMLEKDSQLIVLTHKYMGLDAADANIETFRQINNIKNNNVFIVPKGTQIVYYV